MTGFSKMQGAKGKTQNTTLVLHAHPGGRLRADTLNMGQLSHALNALAAGGGGAVVGGATRTQVVHREVVTVAPKASAPRRPNYAVMFVIDVSGSMACEGKLAEAIAAVKAIAAKLLAPYDSIGIVLFSTRTSVLLPLTRLRHVTNDQLKEKLNGIWTGSMTALWDGVLEGFDHLCNRKNLDDHPYLIVITDGMDNSSSRGAYNRAKATLAKPGDHGYSGKAGAHFHLNFLTIGRDADLDGAREFCEGKPHMLHFHAPRASELAATFRQVMDTLKQTMVKTTTTTTVTTNVHAVGVQGRRPSRGFF